MHFLRKHHENSNSPKTNVDKGTIVALTNTINTKDFFFFSLDFFYRFRGAAKNAFYLKKVGVTHVLNTAEGTRMGMVDTNQNFYRPFGIKYKGFKLLDVAQTNIAMYFAEVADYIDEALKSGGKLFLWFSNTVVWQNIVLKFSIYPLSSYFACVWLHIQVMTLFRPQPERRLEKRNVMVLEKERVCNFILTFLGKASSLSFWRHTERSKAK